jgi:hypothetical protein
MEKEKEAADAKAIVFKRLYGGNTMLCTGKAANHRN